MPQKAHSYGAAGASQQQAMPPLHMDASGLLLPIAAVPTLAMGLAGAIIPDWASPLASPLLTLPRGVASPPTGPASPGCPTPPAFAPESQEV